MYKEVLIQIESGNHHVVDKFLLSSASELREEDIVQHISDNRISWIANKNAKFVEVWEVVHDAHTSYMGKKILNYNLVEQFKF